jgi:hypothetical protein
LADHVFAETSDGAGGMPTSGPLNYEEVEWSYSIGEDTDDSDDCDKCGVATDD